MCVYLYIHNTYTQYIHTYYVKKKTFILVSINHLTGLVYIHRNINSTHILCKHKLLFSIRLIAIKQFDITIIYLFILHYTLHWLLVGQKHRPAPNLRHWSWCRSLYVKKKLVNHFIIYVLFMPYLKMCIKICDKIYLSGVSQSRESRKSRLI